MLVQSHRPNMKPFHYVLGVYVLALLQWETVAEILGEENAVIRLETVQIPDTLMHPYAPELGTWREYARGKLTWEVAYHRIKSAEQFLNRKEIYKGYAVALYIDKGFWNIKKEIDAHEEIMIKTAAEFARQNVHNGIVLSLYNGLIFDFQMDPMTKEIFDREEGRFFYFEMENKFQVIDVADKDELERRHEQYKGSIIYTLYYDGDDFVRVGDDGKYLWEPLRKFMRDQFVTVSETYNKMVLLKVRTSSVLKGDTEFFKKICEAKGEPKEYPVVYYEADTRLNGIFYLSKAAGKWEHTWDKCPFH
ncbi:uncharacterized protein LOC128992247 [Macrosteles quadrilineatus]|uniref:uncharacterized protein LOC128992247 n=1 Tax=Macrosteles quadrilineatus TaxID=74068 RepID=UPI0023E113B6|nr:uncharacterized protein LOC128992247 [Macrosteles quadrilineatus]